MDSPSVSFDAHIGSVVKDFGLSIFLLLKRFQLNNQCCFNIHRNDDFASRCRFHRFVAKYIADVGHSRFGQDTHDFDNDFILFGVACHGLIYGRNKSKKDVIYNHQVAIKPFENFVDPSNNCFVDSIDVLGRCYISFWRFSSLQRGTGRSSR